MEYRRNVAVHKIPFGQYQMQDLGLTRRVMRGEGEFYGPGAYEEFKRLACVFYSDGPGLLTHPVWQTAKAYFVELHLRQKPRENYVNYSFEFWEDSGLSEAALKMQTASGAPTQLTAMPTAVAQARFHTVVKGESLWGIAGKYALTLERLIELNPKIKNPNFIFVGQQVRVA